MKRTILVIASMLLTGAVLADDITDSNKLLCSSGQVLVCFEEGECLNLIPDEIGVPRFVVSDIKKGTLATTESSGENRSTTIGNMERDGGRILLQGIDLGRAYSFLIDEETGRLTAAVSRDGLTVSVFGACTDADRL